MLTHNKLAVIGAAGLFFAALPTFAKPAPPKATVQTATIENSGSTNTFGYKITATMTETSFRVIAKWNNGHDSAGNYGSLKQLSFPLARLFADLKAAMPLTNLPVQHQMRSVSFGTQTVIKYMGQTSPDLTAATDPRSAALKADIEDLVRTFGVKNLPKNPPIVPVNNAPPVTH